MVHLIPIKMNRFAFKPDARLILGGGSLVGLAYAGANSLFNVEGGHRAVIFNRFGGVSENVYSEGTHIMIPWFQIPVDFEVRARPRNFPSVSGSKDLQMVQLTVRVLTRPDQSKLPFILQTLGTKWDDRVLPSIVEETLKATIAKFTATELLTQREAVSGQIRQLLEDRAGEFNIVVEDVSITHLAFGDEFMAAVEAKQVALQDAERAKFIVDKAEQEKKALVIRAEGEASAARMITNAVKDNPAYLSLRKLEAAREIAMAISNGKNRVYLDSSTLMMPDPSNTTDGKKR